MDATIEVSGLRKRFGPVLALDGMTFNVAPGQVTGFVGPNGAGKSTTMRVILGLDAPDEGRALIGGRRYRALRDPLSHVGALLDAGALQPSRSARNHLLWLARSQGLGSKRVDEVIGQAGLESAARRKAGGYSLGMRQRLGIAAAMLGDPPALMFDEPFNGMDPEGIVWMRGYLRSLAAQGRAVLVSSHLMSELQDAADHLVVVGRGQVIADTSVAKLIAAASGDRVALRTTARTEAMTVLARAGATVAVTGPDTATVSGLPADKIVAVLTRNAVPFSEVSAHRATLEEAYMELTRDAVEFRAAAAGGAKTDGAARGRPSDDRHRHPGPDPKAAGRDGFAQLLRAEWTKFRTVRGWVIGAVVAVLLTVGLGLFAAVGGSSSCSPGNGPARSGLACAPSLPTGPGGGPVSDNFYFVRQPLAGNGSITVRVTSLTGELPDLTVNPTGPGPASSMHAGLMSWAKAGLIIKDGTSEGSAYAAMMVTADHGVRLQADYTQDTPGLPGAVSPSDPRWLRLTRSGDTITGYDSADGAHWTQVGSVRLAGLPKVAQVGLFTTSPVDQVITENIGGGTNGNEAPSQATAVFDHLGLAGSWTADPWSGGYIGSGNYAPGIGSYHQAGGQFAVTGSGDIAPIPSGASAPGGPSITLTNLLIGTFAGLIAVIVVATLFITAEYRRGLIRVTLAASPRRGRVLAAKAVVIGSASFVAGLVAAAAAVIVGQRLARSQQYVFPVSWATELRVVVGTAALIAVVAVLALAVGAMMRRSAAAVTTVIVAIVLPYILAVASILPARAGDWLLRLTPAAGFAVQQAATAYPQVQALYTPSGGYYPLAPWAGLAVLAGFAALALTAAVILLGRRDA